MTVHIGANLKAFLDHRAPDARYASFDYCFNHFQTAREAGETDRLADEDRLLQSCLQLGFYLASWGMMRASGEFYKRSVRGLVPVVKQIAAEPASTWDLDAHNLTHDADQVLVLTRRIRNSFSVSASDTLVTKTILGVFGCVPAFDRYFRTGFGCSTLCKPALKRIGKYYDDNRGEIDAPKVFTLDFATGEDTERRYPKAKIIDMVFFQEGVNLERRKQQLRQAQTRPSPDQS
jgi:hypothetical protein